MSLTVSRVGLALLCGLVWQGTNVSAEAAVGDWAQGDKARVRLVTAGIGINGQLEGGGEIDLEPGWKTYWRTPGAAGIAPQFDFSASSNLRDLALAFPVPHRFDDGYAVSNVYDGNVLLPFTAELGDIDAPVTLSLSLDIGVCEVVCIPEHFEAELAVPPGVTDAPVAIALNQARKTVPGPAEPGVMAVDAVTRDGGPDKRPVFMFDLTVPSPETAEVYVEGPRDWYADMPELVEQRGTEATYRVAFDRLGAKTPIEDATFMVTIVGADRAVEHAIAPDS